MTNEQPEQWAVDVEYLAKLADWAAGQGFCQLDGLPDPDEWCYDKWNELFPKSCGDDYSAQALADGLIASIQHAFAEREAELVRAADYLIELLERINRREVVRDLAEAKATWAALKSREADRG